MRDTFADLHQAGTGLFKAKGSKFHGYAFPLPFHDAAAAEQAVDEHLGPLSRHYPRDARARAAPAARDQRDFSL